MGYFSQQRNCGGMLAERRPPFWLHISHISKWKKVPLKGAWECGGLGDAPTPPSPITGAVWVRGEHPQRKSCFSISWPEAELQEKDGFRESCVLPLHGRSGARTRVLIKNNGKDDIRHSWGPKKSLALHCTPEDTARGEQGPGLDHSAECTNWDELRAAASTACLHLSRSEQVSNQAVQPRPSTEAWHTGKGMKAVHTVPDFYPCCRFQNLFWRTLQNPAYVLPLYSLRPTGNLEASRGSTVFPSFVETL